MQTDIGLSRSTFSLYSAIFSLITGVFSPVTGTLSEKNKIPGLVILFGSIFILLGLFIQTKAEELGSVWFPLVGGVVFGLGQSATGVSIALGAVGRLFPPEMSEKRTYYFGLISALSQSGNLVLAPLGRALITQFGWKESLLILVAQGFIMIPLSYPLRYQPNQIVASQYSNSDEQIESNIEMDSDLEIKQTEISLNRPLLSSMSPNIFSTSLKKLFSLPSRSTNVTSKEPDTVYKALREALTHGPFVFLSLAWFVCGWHIAFIGTNLPAYLQDQGLSADIGAWSLSTIGIGSSIGTFLAGYLPSRYPTVTLRRILFVLYFTRGIMIVLLMILPLSNALALIFAGVFGLAWLSTVPVTTGLIANIYGTRWLSTLSGLAFMVHQVGGFLGVYLGGLEFQYHKSYVISWWTSCGLAFIASAFVFFVNDTTLRFWKKNNF
ncbi:hypothetical protein HK096_002062 [Nowakowskiella sp. JEL0078]|nr:hypothetical protein HK096_002062 [Nowakowskiella sp. JEL0078]